jgi:hypothetical protein
MIIGTKIIRLQDAKYKLNVNGSNEASIFIENTLATNLSIEDNVEIRFRIKKIDVLKLLSFTFSFNKPIYGKQEIVNLDEHWFKDKFDKIETHFLDNNDIFIFKGKGQTQSRKYLISLAQVGGLNLRDLFIENHVKLLFEKIDSDIWIKIKTTDDEVSVSESEILIENELDSDINFDIQHQIIFYGSPGTGKSREVENRTKDQNRTRTTFHPETDYNSFVGSYKPVMSGDNIIYDFVPQAFTNAYCNAWLNPNQPYYLIIEEINRGNCAQIFGDIFQSLDRDENGQSKYEIHCDKDLALYLKGYFDNSTNEDAVRTYKEIIKTEDFDIIILPSNLFIYATMNTSDQSLFPMDSAFKRRWDWEFISINYEDASTLSIKIDDTTSYNWGKFISAINPKIKELTGSEDKQLGNRFINPSNGIITFEQFRSKVLFYLWSEVYKDEVGSQNSIFKRFQQNNEPVDFQFGELYDRTNDETTPHQIVIEFMEYNGVEKVI